MKYIIIALLSFFSFSVFSAEVAPVPNFTCEFFTPDGLMSAVDGGQLELFETQDPSKPNYKMTTRSNSLEKKFSGLFFIYGMQAFDELEKRVQKVIINTIKTSRNPELKTGDLMVFGNTQDPDKSTLRLLLMPTAELGYVQLGFGETLCQ